MNLYRTQRLMRSLNPDKNIRDKCCWGAQDEIAAQAKELKMLANMIREQGITNETLVVFNSKYDNLLDRCAGYTLPKDADYIDRRMCVDTIVGLEGLSDGLIGLYNRAVNTIMNYYPGGSRFFINLVAFLVGGLTHIFRSSVGKGRRVVNYVKNLGLDEDQYRSKVSGSEITPYDVAKKHAIFIDELVNDLPAAIKSVNANVKSVPSQVTNMIKKLEKIGVKVNIDSPKNTDVDGVQIKTVSMRTYDSGYSSAQSLISNLSGLMDIYETADKKLFPLGADFDSMAKEIGRRLSSTVSSADDKTAVVDESIRNLAAVCWGIYYLLDLYIETDIVKPTRRARLLAGTGRDIFSTTTITDFFN